MTTWQNNRRSSGSRSFQVVFPLNQEIPSNPLWLRRINYLNSEALSVIFIYCVNITKSSAKRVADEPTPNESITFIPAMPSGHSSHLLIEAFSSEWIIYRRGKNEPGRVGIAVPRWCSLLTQRTLQTSVDFPFQIEFVIHSAKQTERGFPFTIDFRGRINMKVIWLLEGIQSSSDIFFLRFPMIERTFSSDYIVIMGMMGGLMKVIRILFT